MTWIFAGIIDFAHHFLIILFSFVPVGLWISAIAAGVKVALMSLIGETAPGYSQPDHSAVYQGAKGWS